MPYLSYCINMRWKYFAYKQFRMHDRAHIWIIDGNAIFVIVVINLIVVIVVLSFSLYLHPPPSSIFFFFSNGLLDGLYHYVYILTHVSIATSIESMYMDWLGESVNIKENMMKRHETSVNTYQTQSMPICWRNVWPVIGKPLNRWWRTMLAVVSKYLIKLHAT